MSGRGAVNKDAEDTVVKCGKISVEIATERSVILVLGGHVNKDERFGGCF
jgi:hypothetical protein